MNRQLSGGERLQGAAVGTGLEPQHRGHGGGGRGGDQHPAAQHLRLSHSVAVLRRGRVPQEDCTGTDDFGCGF